MSRVPMDSMEEWCENVALDARKELHEGVHPATAAHNILTSYAEELRLHEDLQDHVNDMAYATHEASQIMVQARLEG